MRRYFAAVVIGAMGLVGCESSQDVSWSQESRTISVDTQPQGARVWQMTAPSGSRVDLGMTPIQNQQVLVLSKYHGTFTNMQSAQETMSSLNLVRLHIEKAGYQPYDLTLSPMPGELAHRSVVLEPTTQLATTTAPSASN